VWAAVRERRGIGRRDKLRHDRGCCAERRIVEPLLAGTPRCRFDQAGVDREALATDRLAMRLGPLAASDGERRPEEPLIGQLLRVRVGAGNDHAGRRDDLKVGTSRGLRPCR
jgi:hypothetical protein